MIYRKSRRNVEAQILSWPKDRIVMWDKDYQRVTSSWRVHQGTLYIELGLSESDDVKYNTVALPYIKAAFPPMELSTVFAPADTIKKTNEITKKFIHEEEGT